MNKEGYLPHQKKVRRVRRVRRERMMGKDVTDLDWKRPNGMLLGPPPDVQQPDDASSESHDNRSRKDRKEAKAKKLPEPR